MTDLIDLFCTLARIPSPSLQEEAVADKIIAFFTENNIDAKKDSFGNVYAEIPATDVRKGWFLDENGESPNLSAVFQEYITGAGAPVYTQVKYAPNGNEAGTSNNDNDIPLMRVEEMYFIIAEAQAMGGNPSEGAQTLQGFVQAYRDPAYVCTATTGEDVQEAVWMQRRIEFWGEGVSYFDIMRLGKGVNRLGCGFPASTVFNIQPGDPVLVYPIPYDEVQYNPLCVQNEVVSVPTPIPDTQAGE